MARSPRRGRRLGPAGGRRPRPRPCGGLVHRDVKHANLLLRGDGDRRLILAECGTVAYMAPEHFAGQATPASDTYALACIAWEEEVLGSGTTRGCVGSADRPPCAGNCWRRAPRPARQSEGSVDGRSLAVAPAHAVIWPR